MKYIYIALVSLIGPFISVFGQNPGTLDMTFGTDGKIITLLPNPTVDDAYPMMQAMTGDGKIISLVQQAYFLPNDVYADSLFLYCTLPNGLMDETFGNRGKQYIAKYASQILISNSGKILLMGNHEGEIVLHQYSLNGRLDTSYGESGYVYSGLFGNIAATRIEPDGSVRFCGSVLSNKMLFVAHFLPSGSRNFNYGDDGIVLFKLDTTSSYEYCSSIIKQADGKLLVGCHTYVSSGLTPALVRLLPNGTLDPDFGEKGISKLIHTGLSLRNMVLQPDGKIVYGGFRYNLNYTATTLLFGRLHTNGNTDSSFAVNGLRNTSFSGTLSFVKEMKMQHDGKVLVTGDVDGKLAMIRLKDDGALDELFGTAGRVSTILGTGIRADCVFSKIVSDGKILLTGISNTSGSNWSVFLAKYLSGVTVGKNELEQTETTVVYPNPAIDKLSFDLSNRSEKTTLRIVDMQGKQITEQVLSRTQNTVNVQDWEKGIYLYTLSGEDGYQSGKFVVK